MKCMGIDPGTKNFACVMLNNNKCTYASMFHSPINSLTDDKYELFFKAIDKLIYDIKPNIILIERFAVRTFGTKLIELVSVMVGSVLTTAYNLNIKSCTTIAVTWKSAIKRAGHDLDRLYETGKKSYAPPHIVDALLMSYYIGNNKSFDKFSKKWFNTNVKIAASMLDEKDQIKPKRKKNAMPSKSKRRRR
jgi:hypothetical protein